MKESILISIINWNASDCTLKCIHSLNNINNAQRRKIEIIIIDNGSAEADLAKLKKGLDSLPIKLLCFETNLGFAGGHNISINIAKDQGYDYLWLLNNDAIVECSTLDKLLEVMVDQPRCGAASPVIKAMHDPFVFDFCGAAHDWESLSSIRPATLSQAAELMGQKQKEFWLYGTAILFRTKALIDTGPLNESFFAYYEDDDIGVRLVACGWYSKLVLESTAYHERSLDGRSQRPPYYFYLMTRNSFLFWMMHTPEPYRKLIRLRLLSRALLEAAILREAGYLLKYNACLLGAHDGLYGRSGQPLLNRNAPAWLRIATYLLPYRLSRLLS